LRAKIVAAAKGGAAKIANMGRSPDNGRRNFGRNPKGWHEFSPMTLSLTLPIFAILAADRFAS
jgi:hypothetical protein